MMKRIVALALMCISLMGVCAKAKEYKLVSPNGKLSVTVTVDSDLKWCVTENGSNVIEPSQIAMYIGDNEVWGVNPRVKKVSRGKIDAVVPSPLYKKSEVVDKCNTMAISFASDYAVEFRAYDNAAAYRFVSTKKGDYTVKNEVADFSFGKDNYVYCSYVNGNKDKDFEPQYTNSFESLYEYEPMSAMGNKRLMFLPVLVDAGDKKVCITETDLVSYPGMYLYNPEGNTTLKANYAPVPDEVKQGGHGNIMGIVKTRKPYIAEVSGPRAFPWRICIVANNDAELMDNDMVYLLSEPNVIGDISWIKPGKVAWDWWNDWGLYGVPFKPGVNNETYEYYIDFASRNGIEYVILDEGWSETRKANLLDVVPEIDIKHLVDYGKERGVGIVLWAGYLPVDRDMEKVFSHYSNIGVKGFKVDFMNRDDQKMVEFYERCAATAAKYNLFLDFHGAYKPSGLSRKYPNVLNYEGVHGLEQMKWSGKNTDEVTYDVTIPYIRMVAGPMDYTQGAMKNAQMRSYNASNSEPMSQGTRCHQLAMYVIFEAPFNMLCDSPTNYEKEPECTSFIAAIPTVWDETVALDGKVAEYAVLARRAGDVWYVGGLNGWNPRDLNVNLSFLPAGEYTLEIMKDGVNADKIGRDFLMENKQVSGSSSVPVHMAPGGGFVFKLTPVK